MFSGRDAQDRQVRIKATMVTLASRRRLAQAAGGAARLTGGYAMVNAGSAIHAP